MTSVITSVFLFSYWQGGAILFPELDLPNCVGMLFGDLVTLLSPHPNRSNVVEKTATELQIRYFKTLFPT